MNTLYFETLSSSWLFYSFLGMVLFGVSMTLLKLPSSQKGVSANSLVAWSSFFYLILACIFFLPHVNFNPGNVVLLVALLQGVFYTLRTLLQAHGLKYAQTNALFPTTSFTSLLIVVTVGLLFFGDSLSLIQILGVTLSLVTLFLFAFKGGKLTFSSSAAVKVWLGIVSLSVAGNLLNKVAADIGDIHTFQFFLYVVIFISGIAMLHLQNKGEVKNILFHKYAILGGLAMGVFGFFGAWALITALTKGPVSIAQTINSSSVVVTAVLASVFFNEKITKRKVLLMGCLILALALIKIGS